MNVINYTNPVEFISNKCKKGKYFFTALCIILLLLSTFSTRAANYYWVGGTGNWSDFSTHWATTSGGVIFHTAIPKTTDDVYFDANSFATAGDTVYGDLLKLFCNNMNWNGVTNNPVFYLPDNSLTTSFYNSLSISGSLFVSDSLKLKLKEINFTSTQNGNVIRSQGQSFDSINLKFIGVNGEWQLLDSLCGTPGPDIYIINGMFKSNSQKIRCNVFYTSFKNYPTIVQLDSSQVNCNYWADVPDTICTLNLYNTRINCSEQFYGGYGRSYHYLNVGSGRAYSSNIDSLFCHDFYSMGCHVDYVLAGSLFGDDHGIITKLEFKDSAASFGAFGGTYGTLIIPKDISTECFSATIDSLIFNSLGSVLTIRDTLSVNNIIGLNGVCNNLARIEPNLSYSNNHAVLKKLSDTLSLDNIFIKNVNATGGAVFQLTNSYLDGNETGWNISSPAPRNLFWVGDAGNWSDSNHWSLSSGGSSGNCPPNNNDSVFFDANSFSSSNQQVFLDDDLNFCAFLDFTGANAPIVYGNLNTLSIEGSLKLVTGMTFKTLIVSLSSAGANNYLETNGSILDSVNFVFAGSGSYTLHDSVTIKNNGGIAVTNGTFNTNGFNLTCDFISFLYISSVTANLGTSKITCSNFYAVDTTYLKLFADSALIVASSVFYPGDYQHYKSVNCGYAVGGNYSIENLNCNGITGLNCHIDTLNFSNGELRCYSCEVNQATFHGKIDSYGGYSHYKKAVFDSSAWFRYTVYFDSLLFVTPGCLISIGDTLLVNDYISVNSNCANYTTIRSSEPGTVNIISKPNGIVNFSNVLLKEIDFTGGAVYAATNSFSYGNVSGINISAPSQRTIYWVGNSGDWSDANHWSTISGGTGGSCPPTQLDNVFFDLNSFTTSSDTVTITRDSVYCKSMDWTGANQPVFSGQNKAMKIFGSLKLATGVKFLETDFVFEASTIGNTITTKGVALDGCALEFKGLGTWDLMDSIGGNEGPFINFENGNFNTNNYNINCTSFYAYNIANNCAINFGTSFIRCKSWFMSGYINVNTNAAIIQCDSSFSAGKGNYGNISCVDFNGYGFATFKDVTCTNMQLQSTSVNNATVGGMLIANNSTIGNAYLNGPTYNGLIYINCQTTTIHKALIAASPYFTGSPIFDTLIINGSGLNIVLNNTLRVNNSLYISGTATDPTFITGDVGYSSFISAALNDTVCLDYLYMQGINTKDSAVFYAGANSVDLGNNTGWIWRSCTPDTSNVWPGDANYDLTADNIDLLYVGLAYGYTGTTRAGATNNWVAQPSADWLQQFANGINIKQADCDGNGVVDANDTLAISLNYGQVHPLKISTPPQLNNFGTDLYFDMPVGALTPGTMVSIPINFGTALSPANNIYGIGFTINYDPTLVAANSMNMDVNNSWIGDATNTLNLSKDFPLNGTIDFGFTKTNHQNSSGNGTIATLNFTVANNASGYLNLSFSKILVLDRNEFPVPVNAQSSAIYTAVEEQKYITNIAIYPNPVTNQVEYFIALEFAKKAIATL